MAEDYAPLIIAARTSRGWSQAKLAEVAGTTQSTVDRIEKGGSSKHLIKVARAAGVPIGIDPKPELPAEGFRPAPQFFNRGNSMPVFASAEGSNHLGSLIIDNSPFEYLPKPYILEDVPEAFAVLIEGESMFPAYEPGDKVWVNPRLGYRRDMDGIFYCTLPDQERAMIKRLRGWSDEDWRVEQWNPHEEFRLSRKEWARVYRVVGKFSKA